MSGVVLLAQDTGDVWSGWTGPGSSAFQIVIVAGAVFLVVLAVFIWAAFVRKPRRKRVHSYHNSSSDDGGLPRRHKRRSIFSRAFGKRHRHRRRRAEGRERPMNPTLSQVGGLPQSRREPPPGS